MTALAANAPRRSQLNTLGPVKFGLAAVDIFYVGAILMRNAAGKVSPVVADDHNNGVCGVCTKYLDNSADVSGAVVEYQEGVFLVSGANLTQAKAGLTIYAQDDNSVDVTQLSTTGPVTGIIMDEYISATQCWARIQKGLVSAAE